MTEDHNFRVPIVFIFEDLGDSGGELIRYLSPKTVNRIEKNLPLEGRTALSEKGVYFGIPLIMGKEKAKFNVEKGVIAYWPQGNAICIFYDKAKTYSPVNIIGRIMKNLELVAKVKSGTKIRFERVINEGN